jgi:hypothetical protein
VTALVVQDLFGGELLLAEVRNADGSRQGMHYWNRLADGVELDLTREQFTPCEIVQAPTAVAPPTNLASGRLATQYQALASAVRAGLLGRRDSASTDFPNSNATPSVRAAPCA